MQWTREDVQAFEARGWTIEHAENQISLLRSGSDLSRAIRPAVLGDGIDLFSDAEFEACRAEPIEEALWARFIPASGAATRMFSGFEGPDRERLLARWQRDAHRAGLTEAGESAEAAVRRWGSVPKGFLPFWTQDGRWMTAFEAHARENQLGKHRAALDFSIPASALAAAEPHLPEARWHVQAPSTDTLAWDVVSDAPARTDDGALRFRPGGHGALLQVLEALPAGVVSIRNVDNVVPLERMARRAGWAEALAGCAVRYAWERDVLFEGLDAPGGLEAANTWLRAFYGAALTPQDVRAALCRPVRVAGMVRAAGHVGGGPFWVRSEAGGARLGILEGVEVPEGMASGTHFNPVELACVPTLPGGQIFHAAQFSNPSACFTSTKEVEGRTLRILEHPGLWNGAMEGWLTRFVELPADLFRPVKTWEDLIPE